MRIKTFKLLSILIFAISQILYANVIEQIHIRGQVSKYIDEKSHIIIVTVNYYGKNGIYPLSHAVVESFKTVSGVNNTLPDTLDLRNWTKFNIGSTEWKIKGGYQLPNSKLDKWHTEKVKGFATFGRVKCEHMAGVSEEQYIWDNGNPAFSTSGSKKWPTKKIVLSDGQIAAELTTRKVMGVIASGNLFTGRIVRNMSLAQLLKYTFGDGKDLIKWGIPFEGRPKALRVKFKYDGLGDSCTIMTSLENHSDGVRKYVATAWYSAKTDNDTSKEGVESISAPDKNGLRTMVIKFIYGTQHKNADPLPKGAVQGNANDAVTHISIVFASSRKGDYFVGVENARMIVKDYELIY